MPSASGTSRRRRSSTSAPVAIAGRWAGASSASTGSSGARPTSSSPALVHDSHFVEPPRTYNDGYHLTEDLVDRAIEYLDDLRHVDVDKPCMFGPVNPSAFTDLPAHEDVLRNRQLAEQLRLLIDRRYSQGHRIRCRSDRDLPALIHDSPDVRGDGAGQDLDQRGLAGAVLTDQGQDPSHVNGHVRMPYRTHRAEAFRDTGHL